MDPQDIDDSATAKRKALDNLAAGYDVSAATASAPPPAAKRPKPTSDEEDTKRHARLESNRKAARESRRRKKVLVEELQRSVVFFTRTNAQLRQNNDVLEGMLFSAHVKIEGRGGGGGGEGEGEGVNGGATWQAPAVTTVAPVAMVMRETAAAAARGGDDALAAALPQMTTASVPIATTAPPPTPVVVAAAAIAAPPAPRDAPPSVVLPSPADVLLRQQQQNNQNALMANWLAMAQAAQQVSANTAGISGMVPNPMLAIPGLFGNVGVVNPMVGMAGGNNPFALGQQMMMHQQHQQQIGPGPSAAGNFIVDGATGGTATLI